MRFVAISFHAFSDSHSIEWMRQRLSSSLGFLNYLPAHWQREYIIFATSEEQEQVGPTKFSIFLKKQSGPWSPAGVLGFWKFVQYLRKQKPDLILIEGYIYPVQTILLRWFLSSKVMILLQHHGESPSSNRLKRWLQVLACKRADAFLFTARGNANAFVANKLIKDTRRIFEIPEASTHFTRQSKVESRKVLGIKGSPVFLSVGRLNEGKDPLTILKAFDLFARNHPGATLYMLYQTEELIEAVRQNAVKQVILVGPVAHAHLETWFSAADFFVSASKKEGSGYALIEAMACGCIPIVSDIPPFVKLTNKSGFLFETSNYLDLAIKMEEAATCNIEMTSQKVEANFNNHLQFKSIAQRLVEISDQLIA